MMNICVKKQSLFSVKKETLFEVPPTRDKFVSFRKTKHSFSKYSSSLDLLVLLYQDKRTWSPKDKARGFLRRRIKKAPAVISIPSAGG